MVEVKEGSRTKVVSSCVYPIKDGIEVNTNTQKVIHIRKNIIMLLLLRTPNNPYIQKLAEKYKVEVAQRHLDNGKTENCILCGLCVKACEKIGTNAISMVDRGTTKKVSTPYEDPSKDCIGCGACAEICPTNTISFIDQKGKRTIWNKTFDLIQCRHCGRFFTTLEAYEYTNHMLKEGSKEEEPICENCKRKRIGEKFKEAFETI